MSKLSFIDLKYKPTRSDLICEFYVKPAPKVTLRQASDTIACESSIGTWTDIKTLSRSIIRKLKPHVFSINQNTNIVKIAYPITLFERGNIPQLLSSIAGNIFGMKLLKSLRLEDIKFPPTYTSAFKGPKYGVRGVRKLLRIRERPILGTIVKPKLGLSAKQHAKVAYNAWVGGIDAVKDDENLTSMSFNHFKDRVAATLSKRDKAEKKTGEKKVYFPNVTAETGEMIRRAEYVRKLGGEYIMVDIITCGWSSLQALRAADLGLAIHAHRAGYAALSRNPHHGISMMVIAKLARLIGVDTLHTGTAGVGKMQNEDTVGINEMLGTRWKGIETVLPVASGGLYPGAMSKLLKILGHDIVAQMGGGIHGNQLGTRAGARAARQAVDAVMMGLHLNQYASTHKALRQAISQWGVQH